MRDLGSTFHGCYLSSNGKYPGKYWYPSLGRKFDSLKINSRQDRDVLKCICLPFNAGIPRDRSALKVVNGITSTSVRFKNDFYDH